MKTSKVDDGFTPSFLHWKVKDIPELIPRIRFGATRKSCVSAAYRLS
jgi:hypothetical protein